MIRCTDWLTDRIETLARIGHPDHVWRIFAYLRVLRWTARILGWCACPTVARVDVSAIRHVLAILSMPCAVWRVNARGLGTVRTAPWRTRSHGVPDLAHVPRVTHVPWRFALRVALTALLLWAAWTSPGSGVLAAALGAGTIWEVQTGGSDTLNGGAFDPGQTAGMLTNGAATAANTSAPVFTSVSYNFVPADVGAWIYIASGTNWIPGWYKIASVASNAATLNGTIGQGVLKPPLMIPSTAIGCAIIATPTAATFSIDYSQQAAARFAYTDLANAATGLTVTSAAFPFGKQQVGNMLTITGGTNFNVDRYVIASVSTVTATLLRASAGTLTTGAGASGTGGLGGSLASVGQCGAKIAGLNRLYVQTGAYTITSATANISGGRYSVAATNLEGYASRRGDLGTPPVFTASGIATFTLFTLGGPCQCRNLTLDGAALAASRGVYTGGDQRALLYKVAARNFTNTAIVTGGTAVGCVVTGCTTVAAFDVFHAVGCEASGNAVTGFQCSTGQSLYTHCIAANNTGAASDGFLQPGAEGTCVNCVAYGNGRHGFSGSVLYTQTFINCLAEANGGWGWSDIGPTGYYTLVTCGAFNNTSGAIVAGLVNQNVGFLPATASFFVAPASGNFALNTLPGGGALARAAGYPGTFPGGTTTGFLDLGAAQHADPLREVAAVFVG